MAMTIAAARIAVANLRRLPQHASCAGSSTRLLRSTWPRLCAPSSALASRSFSTESNAVDINTFADRCDLNIVYSPYPPVPDGPYPHLAEFVMEHWKTHNQTSGYLSEKTAIRDTFTGLTRTFDEYYETATKVAGYLSEELELQEDSCVALYCPNHVDYLPISLAVSLCGSKLTPINPMYTTGEVETVLTKSHSTIMFVHHTKLEDGLAAAQKCPKVQHIVVVTDHGEAIPEGTIDLTDLRTGHNKVLKATKGGMHRHTNLHTVLLPYSSGTTGAPKGVCLTHENLVVNLMQMQEVEQLAFPVNHKLISPLPFFHIYAFTLSMLYCAWKGHELITSSGRFDLVEFCTAVQEHKPERTHLVPPILLALAKHPTVDNYDLSSFKAVISAAAPLPRDVEEGVQNRLGMIVKQGWGMSELSPLGHLNSDFNNKSTSIGPLVPSTCGKIVDDNGNSLPANEAGELMIKGPQVMMGYLDDHKNTAECLSGSGWLKTGDVAHYDEDGYFYITDRIKELIKVRGYQVAPAELEALLLTHEHINDVAVIQIPDDEAGELPRAYVVMKDSDEARKETEEAIKAWVKERVAPFKRLEGGVIFTDMIPKSASGKILRRILRDQVKEELAAAGGSS